MLFYARVALNCDRTHVAIAFCNYIKNEMLIAILSPHISKHKSVPWYLFRFYVNNLILKLYQWGTSKIQSDVFHRVYITLSILHAQYFTVYRLQR